MKTSQRKWSMIEWILIAIASIIVGCAILGYDWIVEGMESDTQVDATQAPPHNTVFYGEQGATVTISSDNKLNVVIPGTTQPVVFQTSPAGNTGGDIESFITGGVQKTVYYGPNGEKATIVRTTSGTMAVRVETQTGRVYMYNMQGNHMRTQTSTQYAGSTGTPIQPPITQNTPVPAPAAASAIGIPKSNILPGTEDLYILKSQVVPPVCPACPAATTVPRQEKCPPCPACARCPEPAFECKKVPNYDAIDSDYLPRPMPGNFGWQ